MPKTTTTHLELVDQIPPPLMFALARKEGTRTRYTMAEISAMTGISERTLVRMSGSLSWGPIQVGKLSAVASAFDVDFLRLEDTYRYLRRNMVEMTNNQFPHLTTKQRRCLFDRMALINERQGISMPTEQ